MPALRMHVTPSSGGTELQLRDGDRTLAPSSWALEGHPGAEIAQLLLSEGMATEDSTTLLVENVAIARLTAAQANRLGLPLATSLRAVIEGSGVMVRPDFTVRLRWTRPNGQNVLGVRRTGAWLHEPQGLYRLPEVLFSVAEAVEAHAQAAQVGEDARIATLPRLHEVLPAASSAGLATGEGLLGKVTLVEADAFSLQADGDGEDLRLLPVLHRAGAHGAPLLPDDRQNQFAQQFLQMPTARGFYTLPGGVYVMIAPPLRKALEVVREAARQPAAYRRAFLRSPRTALREVIGDDETSVALLEEMVVETPAWSERVIGLGLWEPRVLPWIALPPNDWFAAHGGEPPPPLVPKGLIIGDRAVPLTPEEAEDAAALVAQALAAGESSISFSTSEGEVRIPVNEATREALATLRADTRTPKAESAEAVSSQSESLLIYSNEGDRDLEALVQRRQAPPPGLPKALVTQLKPHQLDGLSWLQKNWATGAPGVLLADDMGLGKTLQGLAFLAWLRQGMVEGHVQRHPLLIVAPTGLLENWRAEHERHLSGDGLGWLVAAYGKGLAGLRRSADGMPALDLAKLRDADWVLTTYETLRDHDRDFGAVHFAAILLDEAQKVKTPAIRLTDAAKAMNADFRIAMTGTPVENRLADLWCIVDGVAPGHLGDLRRFSATYEAQPDRERILQLKASLDRPLGPRPPLMLRRLKENELPDLPKHTVNIQSQQMGERQLEAYEAALDLARDDRRAGRVLEALMRLRAVSLHPDADFAVDDETLIAGSARLRLAVKSLDEIREKGERALVFLDARDLMCRLAPLFQRRYKLAAPPMIINGTVVGAARQARVDRFQRSRDRFDVMLLSPQAGGVGLTLTSANHVVHLARWWNPAVEDQCNGRVLRIGQERPVTIHIPLATLPAGHRSFDESLHALLERKRRLMQDALMPTDPDADRAEMLNEAVW